MGYNVYYLIDIYSGVELRRSRYQLEPIPVPVEALAAGKDSDFIMEDSEPVPSTSGENTRLACVSAPELDEIELNRCSFNTQKQTSWSVKIFKG